MVHTYKISGMTCSSCRAKVQSLLSQVEHVKKVDIDLAKGEAQIEMEKHIPTTTLRTALKDYPKYQLSEDQSPVKITEEVTDQKSWFQTYKPILVIFFYLTLISILLSWNGGQFDWMTSMNIFMGGFFLTFSFFKMLDLDGFADSYAMYDVVARKFKSWGYIYAFIELALGLAFITGFMPFLSYIVALVVMSVSIVGVLKSVLDKTKIRCACLGSVFNLPMSTVTIIEDGLMIAMSGFMLLYLL